MRIVIGGVSDWVELGQTWRGLEADVTDLPFFRSWSWVGCLAEERYPEPVLVRAEEGGRLVGLALFNRRGGRLHLTETGDPALDAPFVEHNGPLRHDIPDLEARMLSAALRGTRSRRLVLSGTSHATLAAAPGVRFRSQERVAPWVDLDAVRGAGSGYLATLSANTRQQIRRSFRHYGGLQLDRAETTEVALAWFENMMELHERTWRGRGRPGAFGTPWLRRFHRELISRTQPRGELDLLRISSHDHVLSYLYNFRFHHRVYAYQSGTQALKAGPHERPGVTAHVLAIQRSLEHGDLSYDFLAGAQRYKTSLANAQTSLFWSELIPRNSLSGLALRLARRLRLLPES